MEAIKNLLDILLEWLEQNTLLGILLIITSLVANVIAIWQAISQNRKAKNERKLHEEIGRQLAQYEYLFGEIEVDKRVKETIEQKQLRLSEVNKDVEEQQELLQRKENELYGLEQRLQQLVITAQNEALRKTIQQRLELLQSEILDIENLKTQYKISDSKLDIPVDVKENLKQSLQEFIPDKGQLLPQSFLLQIIILATLVLLLPNPFKNLVLILSASSFFGIIFEAVRISKNIYLQKIIVRWHKLIVFSTLYVLWSGALFSIYNLLQAIPNFIQSALTDYYQYINTPLPSGYSDGQLFYPSMRMHSSWVEVALSLLLSWPTNSIGLISLIATFLHYPRVIKSVKLKITELKESLILSNSTGTEK